MSERPTDIDDAALVRNWVEACVSYASNAFAASRAELLERLRKAIARDYSSQLVCNWIDRTVSPAAQAFRAGHPDLLSQLREVIIQDDRSTKSRDSETDTAVRQEQALDELESVEMRTERDPIASIAEPLGASFSSIVTEFGARDLQFPKPIQELDERYRTALIAVRELALKTEGGELRKDDHERMEMVRSGFEASCITCLGYLEHSGASSPAQPEGFLALYLVESALEAFYRLLNLLWGEEVPSPPPQVVRLLQEVRATVSQRWGKHPRLTALELDAEDHFLVALGRVRQGPTGTEQERDRKGEHR